MDITDVADQYFTYDSRLTSFQNAQPLSKRRASNASSKALKSMKWPHKFLSAQELAKAGFFYFPVQANPDNVACFLCHKSLDGWEEDDDPLAEHLKHSPDCGWAIVASIEKKEGELSLEFPSSARMLDARKATFGDKWPYEGKKGWKCKVKQMVEAGWQYTPTPESDDMATCAYCSLALDGWEPGDKPMDEHYNRSPDCTFFSLISNHKQTPKRVKSRKDRTSKASRLSTQSAFTVASEGQSMIDIPGGEEDSVLSTATTNQTGKKMAKGKKVAATKGKKTKAKKAEPLEVDEAPEPEDAGFEVKADPAPKASRHRKRKSELENSSTLAEGGIEAPPSKRRATRTRSTSMNDTVLQGEPSTEQPKTKKGRPSTKSARKISTASALSVVASVPNDDEIYKALEADLDRQVSDHEDILFKKGARGSKISKVDHIMFGVEPMEIDDAEIEAELTAMEIDSKSQPKSKGVKGRQSRKPSAKQQTAPKKAIGTVDEEVLQQILSEVEQNISMHYSSPVVQSKKQRAVSRQLSTKTSGRSARVSKASVISINDSNAEAVDTVDDTVNDQNNDPGNETDSSMASQSTIVRGGPSRLRSNMKKGKKTASRNIEDIVHGSGEQFVQSTEISTHPRNQRNARRTEEDSIIHEDAFASKSQSVGTVEDLEQNPDSKAQDPTHKKAPKGKSTKSISKPQIKQTLVAMESHQKDLSSPQSGLATTDANLLTVSQRRSSTPPARDLTPSQSPQSSDAENHPPSSKLSSNTKVTKPNSISTKKTEAPNSISERISLSATPVVSPSKRNIVAGLQSSQPWTAIDLDTLFLASPNSNENLITGLRDAIEKAKSGKLTSPEKRMTVEEWILYNAELAEEKLRGECEGMVGIFEREGGKAMRVLEGVECVE